MAEYKLLLSEGSIVTFSSSRELGDLEGDLELRHRLRVDNAQIWFDGQDGAFSKKIDGIFYTAHIVGLYAAK